MPSDYQLIVLQYLNGNKELQKLFNYYLNHCTSVCLPYHNMKHTFTVMYHIIQIFENQEKYNIELSTYNLFVLLLTALYHDYNHSGGLFDDSINVGESIYGYINAIHAVFPDMNDYDKFSDPVFACICATQYPYTIDNTNILQTIIRECDIISQISPDTFTHVIAGLKHESRNKHWSEALLAYVDFIVPMLKDLKLQYCKDYWKTNSETFFNIIKLLTETIKLDGGSN